MRSIPKAVPVVYENLELHSHNSRKIATYQDKEPKNLNRLAMAVTRFGDRCAVSLNSKIVPSRQPPFAKRRFGLSSSKQNAPDQARHNMQYGIAIPGEL
jgi:hypothetical protein